MVVHDGLAFLHLSQLVGVVQPVQDLGRVVAVGDDFLRAAAALAVDRSAADGSVR